MSRRKDAPDLRAALRAKSDARMEELVFLLEMGTAVPDVLKRLEFPTTEAAASFARRRGRSDLSRLITLQGGTGDPFTELWERNLLVMEEKLKHSPKEKAS